MHLVMVLGTWVSSRFHRSLVLVVGPKLSFGLYEAGTHVVLKMVERKHILDISFSNSNGSL
jgi:hypothetical protein